MALKCPGRFTAAHADSVIVPCPNCGKEAEIFGDEQRLMCRCGNWVFRAAVPSCAQWCAEAERCFGSVGKAAAAMKDIPDAAEQKARFHELQEQVEKALGRCAHTEERLQHEGEKATDGSDAAEKT